MKHLVPIFLLFMLAEFAADGTPKFLRNRPNQFFAFLVNPANSWTKTDLLW